MDIFTLDGNIIDELVCADEGFTLENPYAGRKVTVVDYPHERYQLTKGNMVAGLTNHETVAVNFLMGG